MSKFTTGKWYANKLGDVIFCKRQGGKVIEIADLTYPTKLSAPENRANARRICQCVNSHDALLEACKRYVRMQEEIQGEMGRKPTNTMYCMMKAAIAAAGKE